MPPDRLSGQYLPARPHDYDTFTEADIAELAPPPGPDVSTSPERRQADRRAIDRRRSLLPPPEVIPPDHRCGITRTDLVVFAIVSACVNAIVSIVALEVLHALSRRLG